MSNHNCICCYVNSWIEWMHIFHRMCMEKICWQPLCQTQLNHLTFTKSFKWQKKWWAIWSIPLLDMHLNGYFSFLFFILYTNPCALRVSDHYPVEVELLFPFGWKRATTDVQLLTPSKDSGELWQVKSKTLIYFVLFLIDVEKAGIQPSSEN